MGINLTTGLMKYLPLYIMLCFFVAGCAAKDLPRLRQEAYQAYERGDYLQAAEKFERLIPNAPRDPELWFRLGNAYGKSQQPGKAVEAYQNALLRDPAFAKAWYNMGLIHMQRALKSYVDMLLYVDEEDPVARRGRIMRDGLYDLLRPEDEQGEHE